MSGRMYRQRVRAILSETPVRAREVLLAVARCGDVATRADVLDAWRAIAPAGTGGREFKELDAEARVLVASGLLTTSPPPWQLTDAGRGIVEYLDDRERAAATPERQQVREVLDLHGRRPRRIRDAILEHLAEHGEVTLAELADAIDASRGSVGATTSALVASGEVIRTGRAVYKLSGRDLVADPPAEEDRELEPGDTVAPAAEATAEDLVDLLALVGAELPVDPLPRSAQRAVGMWSDEVRQEVDAWAARWRVRVASWTEEQRREVDAWASALHLAASDHDDVEVPRTPAVLAAELEGPVPDAPSPAPAPVSAPSPAEHPVRVLVHSSGCTGRAEFQPSEIVGAYASVLEDAEVGNGAVICPGATVPEGRTVEAGAVIRSSCDEAPPRFGDLTLKAMVEALTEAVTDRERVSDGTQAHLLLLGALRTWTAAVEGAEKLVAEARLEVRRG